MAPVTMIVPGVLPGSKGPLYYPQDEIKRNFKSWEGVPLVVGHPVRNGSPVSASEPDAVHVGVVRNVSANGKLKGEAWVDIERLATVNKNLADSLQRGHKIEVSTGLFTDNEPAPPGSNYNGRAFTHIARNYRPDHLAILPNQQGACSVNDGCGLNVNKLVANALLRNAWTDEARQAALEARRAKSRVPNKSSLSSRFSDWVKSWESSNTINPSPKLRRFKDRLVEQTRDLDNSIVSGLAKAGSYVGLTQAFEKVIGSKVSHSSWVDKRTGYRYDFYPKEGYGVSDFVPGIVVETSPDGIKRAVKGPAYNLFKRNCQDAGGFLPRYIKKFVKMRRRENSMPQVSNAWSEEARKAAIEARRAKSKMGGGSLSAADSDLPTGYNPKSWEKAKSTIDTTKHPEGSDSYYSELEKAYGKSERKRKLKKFGLLAGAIATGLFGGAHVARHTFAKGAYGTGESLASLKHIALQEMKKERGGKTLNAWSEAARKAAIEARKRKASLSGKPQKEAKELKPSEEDSDLDKPSYETPTPKKIARALLGAVVGGAVGIPWGPAGVTAGGVIGGTAAWKTAPKGPTKRALQDLSRKLSKKSE